ncbi:MAG: aminotransferase class V-fold PLP-dependent enzyme, partial [bacterium]
KIREDKGTDANYAASKPILLPVAAAAFDLEVANRQNIGRGAGANAEIMTSVFEEARAAIGKFLGYDPAHHGVVFTANTTDGLNLLIALATRDPKCFFVGSLAAHHSSMLPARETNRFSFFDLKPNGTYDLDSLESKLNFCQGLGFRPIVCIESASNVTGIKNPVEKVCWLADKYGAKVFIDHAQGASSMKINLSELPSQVFVAFSGHKTYARDGSGAVVGPVEFFKGRAVKPGGGAITGVTKLEGDIYYAEPAHNLEAGTPAYIAQASLGKAVIVLEEAGMAEIAAREEVLTRGLMAGLLNFDWLHVLGESNLDVVPRGPVISFTVDGVDGQPIPPGFLAKALEVFYGVESRPGQFCAHPYIYHLLNVSDNDAHVHALKHVARGRAGCAALPGDQNYHALRFSFGFPTRSWQLGALPKMLAAVREMWPDQSVLSLDQARGEFFIPGQPRVLTSGTFSLYHRGPRPKLTADHHPPIITV